MPKYISCHCHCHLCSFPSRHLCVNCHCPRDAHQVYHSEFVDIRERIGLEQPEDVKLRADPEVTMREGYTWVPPGLNSHKVRV